MHIAASVLPLASVARQVGGRYVEVSWVVESGQPITSAASTPEVRSQLRNADVVFTGGATEPWADEGFGDPFQHHRIVRLDALEASRELIAHQDLGYLWLDPVIVQDACRELAARLSALRPQYEQDFHAQADEFIARLDALVREYQPRLLNANIKNVLVMGTGYNAMLRRFGLHPIQTGASSPMQLSDAEIWSLKQLSREHRTRLLLVSADTPAIVRRDVELRTGLQLVPIDPLGTSAAGGRDSYLELMRFNLEQLLKATTVQ